jgi:hypothetical protein
MIGLKMNRNKRIDLIFNLFDDLMREGKFETIDILLELILNQPNVDDYLSLLTITIPAKNKLSARKQMLLSYIDLCKSENLKEGMWVGL